MASHTLIRTPTWQLRLPEEWHEQGQSESGEAYFETQDGTKGVYVATWNIPASDKNNSRVVAQSFRSAEMASLKRMEGYEWELLLDEFVALESMFITICDAWAPAKAYRIASKVIADVPVVVRAAFHDYQCDDLEESQLYFAAIIHSLQRAA
ncbi:MAG TPA: hypothetical protein VMZ74_17560 [Ramlibacter sp.]|nr:hypothetical protein [Ramlibacter sp.]